MLGGFGAPPSFDGETAKAQAAWKRNKAAEMRSGFQNGKNGPRMT